MSKKGKGPEGVGLSAFRPSNSARAKARATQLMADKAGTVRINFDLDLRIHRRLRIRAVHENVTVAALLRRAIEDLVDAQEEP